ncbi:MAG: sigma 54-interacting transcriptional regulator [Deltaproteobacteria bacterium]|nr:sigma 54-interacting transcriptional regulator [Deltaproteobacteria bacterium]
MQRRGDVDGINAGSIVAGRYRIVARLGGGEEGSVWKAADLRAGGEACAVKVQHRAIDASHARLLLSLDHPHLARTRDLGSLPGGGSFAVMDLVEGVSLDAVSETAAVVRAGVCVAGALEALHAVGIVHGDVKPSNILVRGDRAVLVDLGAAIGVGERSAGLRGSLAFAAPEALFGAATPSRDLYALGVSLAMALGGGHPLVADATDARAVLASLGGPEILQEGVFARIPGPLRSVIAACVATDPSERPSSAGSFLRRWSLDGARWLPETGAVRAWTTDDEAVPAAPRWQGDRTEAARVAEAIAAAMGGASAGVILVGPEGSGRRRLLEDALRLSRVAAASRGEVLAREDGTPAPCERPTVFVMEDASPEALSAALATVERSRRFGVDAPMAVLATSAQAPGGARVSAFERTPLSGEAMGALLSELHRAPVAGAVVERWRAATGGWSGRVVRAVRAVGPSAIPTAAVGAEGTPGEGASPEGLTASAARLLRGLALVRSAVALDALAEVFGDALGEAVAGLRERGLIALEGGRVAATVASAAPLEGERGWVIALAGALGSRHPRGAGAAARLFAWAGDREGATRETVRALAEGSAPIAERIALLREAGAWADPTSLAALLCRAGRHGEARALTEGASTPTAVLLHGEILLRAGERDAVDAWVARHVAEGGAKGVAAGVIGLRATFDRGAMPSRSEVDAVVSAATAEGSEELVALRALEVAALVALAADDRAEASARCEAWARRLGDRAAGEPRAAGVRGMLAQRSGDLAGAASAYREAWEAASRDGDVRAAATYLMNLGAAALEAGALGEAYLAMRRSVSLFAAEGQPASVARALANLGSLSVWIGAEEESRALLRRAREAAAEAGDALTARWVDALRSEADGGSRAPVEADAVRELGAAALADELRARWSIGAIGSGALEPAAAAMGAPRSDEGAMAAIARLALAVAGHPRYGALEPAEQRARRAVEADASVEHELLLLQWSEGAAEVAGDRGRAESMRSRRRARVDALAATLPKALGECFRRRHAPASKEPARVAPSADDARWRWMLSVVQRINAEPRLPPLLDRVMDAIIELTGASRGFLLLREPDGTLKVRNARNLGERDLVGDEAVLSRSIAERVATTGEPVVTIDASTDQRFDATQSVLGLRLRSVLAVPLRVRGEVAGTIYVDDRMRAGAFDERARSLALAFADAAAVAIDNARSRAELRRSLRRSERLADELERALARQRAELETVRRSVDPAATRGHYDALIGRGDAMRRMLALLDRVAPTPMPVLLQGESGTGKELVARAIHDNSPRAQRPFVAENCGAIPETLLESTLFGHVKGAFTGADRSRAGLFEAADGGTLFLDEIGEMSPAMQSRLLRVLQEGEVRPVGGERVRRVDVRVVAATHRDLPEMVSRGTFREDLYYRLAVIVVRVPSLRDRREDIPDLVAHFLRQGARRDVNIDRAALAALCAAPWPGNVRQLQSEVLRAAVLAEEVIRGEHLTVTAEVRAPSGGHTGLDLRNAVEDVERAMVLQALAEHGGNQTHAAKTLGLSRFGLQKKLRRLGVSARDVSAAEGGSGAIRAARRPA